MKITSRTLYLLALSVALPFHIFGAAGILFSQHKEWFINSTPLLLILMFVLLVITHQNKNLSFFLFIAAAYITGLVVEIIGVNTGFLFGNYSYGNVLGYKVMNVPVLIGINWFIIVYCTGVITTNIELWLISKVPAETQLTTRVRLLSFIFDAALLTTLFDWLMEPVAQKLGYWRWSPARQIPFYNYVCWFFISAILLTVFRKLGIRADNKFAIDLFIIQVLFFLALRILL